jgi:hypothetical protein
MEPIKTTTNQNIPHITIFEHGEWLIMDNSKIMEYSIIEDKNQPKESGYDIYDMSLITT